MLVTNAEAAFVTTNSLCQGGQVSVIWPHIYDVGINIRFAYTSFTWSNLATNNAGITVIIVGLTRAVVKTATLYKVLGKDEISFQDVGQINAYLKPLRNVIVPPSTNTISTLPFMGFGNHPYYAAPLIFSPEVARSIVELAPEASEFIRPIYGSTEVIDGDPRMCIWVSDDQAERANRIPQLSERFEAVRTAREAKKSDATARSLVNKPYRFRDQSVARNYFIAVPQSSSENRDYLPCDLLTSRSVVTFKCFALNDASLWCLGLVASRLHWVWIGTVCARIRTDFSYSNTLGWNTFPVPPLTANQKDELTRCAEGILLAREAHFPLTIADLYDPERMPEDLRRAHERNDETLERIYVGRRFRNDTERLEHLFERYVRMRDEEKGKGEKEKKPRAKRAKGVADESLL